jgi:hypothetical protein
MKKSSKTPLEHLWSMIATGNIAATDIYKVQSWYFKRFPEPRMMQLRVG